jgi:hypothetical protein
MSRNLIWAMCVGLGIIFAVQLYLEVVLPMVQWAMGG